MPRDGGCVQDHRVQLGLKKAAEAQRTLFQVGPRCLIYYLFIYYLFVSDVCSVLGLEDATELPEEALTRWGTVGEGSQAVSKYRHRRGDDHR